MRPPDKATLQGIRPVAGDRGRSPSSEPEPLLELGRWMSAYYCCPIEAVIRSLLPQVVRRAEVGWKKQLFVSRRPRGRARKNWKNCAAALRARPNCSRRCPN